MKAIIKTAAICALVVLAAANSFASTWTNFSNFTSVTGTTIRNNEIWVSAKGGLVMYDNNTGAKTFFQKGTNQLPSLSVEVVRRSPAAGNIWIGTYDNGIAKFDGTNWEHHAFPLEDAMLYQMRIAANGAVWCATSRGLFKYENNQFTSYLVNQVNSVAPMWDFDLFSDGRILCSGSQPYIYDPSNGQSQMLVTTAFAYGDSHVYVKNDSVYYFSGDHGTVAEFKNGIQVDSIEINGLLYNMDQSANGTLLALNSDHVLLSFADFHHADTLSLGSGIATAFAIDGNGEKWGAGVANDTATLFHANGQAQVAQIDLRRSGLQNNWCRGLSPSQNGNILVSNDFGVEEFDLDANAFTNKWGTNALPLYGQQALELNGKIYIGTSYQYLRVYSGGQWQQLGNGILPSGEVDHLSSDKAGNLWISGPGYIAKYDGSQFTVFDSHNAPVLTPNLYTRAIYCDSTNNAVWVATYNGIIKYKNGVFSLLNDTNTAGIQQYYGAIESIAEDLQHNIWFGTVYGGLLKFDGTNFSTMLVPVTAGNQVITSMAFIGNTMYVGDNLRGVWVYENAQWDSLNINNSGIVSDYVTSLLADKNGNLWISHLDYGVDVYNKNGLTLAAPTLAADNIEASIFPNPSAGKFMLQLVNVNDAELQIFSTDGKLIRSQAHVNSNTVIDLGKEAAGLYIARLTTGTATSNFKLIRN